MNPFDPFFNVDFDNDEQQEHLFEHQSVQLLLKSLILKKFQRDFLDENGFYSFCQLRQKINLPFHLQLWTHRAATPLYRCQQSVHPRWFKPDFLKIPVVTRYIAGPDQQSSYDDLIQNSEFRGMIFPRKGFRHGLIIHNGSLDYVIRGCHLYNVNPDCRLIVQPYQDFVLKLTEDKDNWSRFDG